jgi:hypothetical protein
MGFFDRAMGHAYARASKNGGTKGVSPVSMAVRWYSSNTGIASVNKNGRISTDATAGTCYIYALAHNGIRERIRITVSDYAHPTGFDLGRVLHGIPDKSLIIEGGKDFLTFYITEITGEGANHDDMGSFHKVRYYYNKDLYDWAPDNYYFTDIALHWGYGVDSL